METNRPIPLILTYSCVNQKHNNKMSTLPVQIMLSTHNGSMKNGAGLGVVSKTRPGILDGFY